MGPSSFQLSQTTPTAMLAGFTANATGQFSAAPEPGTVLVLLSGIPFALLGWRRWWKAE